MTVKKIEALRFAFVILGALAVSGAAYAQIEKAPPLPYDTPKTMRDIEAVCTGIGAEGRNDPRWPEYPLRVEVVGIAGQYLGEAQVTVNKGSEAVVSVTCGGPWVLFKISPGTYDVTVEVEGVTKNGKVNVGAKGQARLLIRFPDLGGAVSPGNAPK